MKRCGPSPKELTISVDRCKRVTQGKVARIITGKVIAGVQEEGHSQSKNSICQVAEWRMSIAHGVQCMQRAEMAEDEAKQETVSSGKRNQRPKEGKRNSAESGEQRFEV